MCPRFSIRSNQDSSSSPIKTWSKERDPSSWGLSSIKGCLSERFSLSDLRVYKQRVSVSTSLCTNQYRYAVHICCTQITVCTGKQWFVILGYINKIDLTKHNKILWVCWHCLSTAQNVKEHPLWRRCCVALFLSCSKSILNAQGTGLLKSKYRGTVLCACWVPEGRKMYYWRIWQHPPNLLGEYRLLAFAQA